MNVKMLMNDNGDRDYRYGIRSIMRLTSVGKKS